MTTLLTNSGYSITCIGQSKEARERVFFAVENALPGTKMRWDKMLTVANRTIAATMEDKDPLRVQLSMKELKMVLKKFYEGDTLWSHYIHHNTFNDFVLDTLISIIICITQSE